MILTPQEAVVTPHEAVQDRDIYSQEQTLDRIRYGVKSPDGSWTPGPCWWAWNCTETFDPHYLDKGLPSPHRSFPRLPYLRWLFAKLLIEPIVFIPKSREMLLSWSAVAYAVWMCQIFPGTQVLIQSQKLDKACELVKGKEPPGYGYTLYSRQDPWLKDRFPLAIRPEDLPADNLVWKNGSEMQALGKGADQIRLYHPTIVIWDEMSFMEEAQASFGAATPVAKQMICVSSAGPGFFGDVCSTE